MLHNLKQSKSGGFTIIEVMIVLAIAGLIMLIVFLAVPALQRNSHNTGRKSDISRIGSAVNDWVSNANGGKFCGVASDCQANLSAVVTDAGDLGQYTLSDGDGGNFTHASGQQDPLASGSVDDVVVVTGAQCSQGDGGTVAGTDRQMAIQYMLESANGDGTPVCQNI